VKKILFILLVMAIPFQYSWAATARYCTHEKEVVSHFGHHSHQHKTQASQSDGGSESKKFHNDCEYCQMFSHAVAISNVFGMAAVSAAEHGQVAEIRYRSHIPDSPPRPDWHLVA
jgi:hypothetical protein